jgi:hypothetical protein
MFSFNIHSFHLYHCTPGEPKEYLNLTPVLYPCSVYFRCNKGIDCTPIPESPGRKAISVKSEAKKSLTETL